MMKFDTLNKDDPDYRLEEFWFTFKTSMYNFYSQNRMSSTIIKTWSQHLNQLKNDKNYSEIQIKIKEYMLHYALDLLNNTYLLSNSKIDYKLSSYDDDIFITNVKRWNKICKLIIFNESNNYIESSKIFLLLTIFAELKNIDGGAEIIRQKTIDELLENNFDHIIRFSIEKLKPKFLDTLKKIDNYNIFIDIKKMYPDSDIPKIIKMSKLCSYLNKISTDI